VSAQSDGRGSAEADERLLEQKMSEPLKPIACSLDGRDYAARIASNTALARRSLLSAERRGLTLHLTYRNDAEHDVRAMVQAESRCCAFLGFEVEPTIDGIKVTITAPERAADTADDLFAQFTG
jgi:hypothetical protein